jgi:hypothetical protein
MFVFILIMPVAAQSAMPEGTKNMPDPTATPDMHASLAPIESSSERIVPHEERWGRQPPNRSARRIGKVEKEHRDLLETAAESGS